MNASQKLVLNTVATYVRSLISAGLALFSSRWVLNALGQTDYGLFSLVGSIIVFITFLNTALATSAGRYFAYSIGQNELNEVKGWFNIALSIHLMFAFILVIIGFPIGEIVIKNYLTIPPDRTYMCQTVFQVSLVSAFVSMISVPFVAMFTAKQHIVELAMWGILNSILVFILALILKSLSTDRLLFYAVGMVIIISLIQVIQIIRALIVFRECNINLNMWIDKKKFKEIIYFAGWNLIDPLGAMFTGQGSAILLNIYFGPVINSAYGIANNVSSQANQLATSMIGAFSPEIIASEGRGDRNRMLMLSQRASKFGTLLVLLFAIPLIIEMDYILKLWLIEPPAYTAIFCRLILIMMIIDRMSTGYMVAVSANGKIKGFQLTIGIAKIMTLPLAWIFLKNGLSPPSVGFAFIIIQTICTFGRVLWARYLFGVKIFQWFYNVFIRCGIVSIASISGASFITHYLNPSLLRIFITTCTCLLISISTIWIFAFDNHELEFTKRSLRNIAMKIIPRKDI